MIIRGEAYNLTKFDHPGGSGIIRQASLLPDASLEFFAVHNESVLSSAQSYWIGSLESTKIASKQATGVWGSGTANLSGRMGEQKGDSWWVRYTEAELARLPSLAAIRAAVSPKLPPPLALHWEYGNEDEETLRANLKAWERFALVPRVLRDVRSPSIQVQLLGYSLSSPVLVAPFATSRTAHPEGEIAIARACSSRGQAFVVPHYSAFPLEEVAYVSKSSRSMNNTESSPNSSAPCFFQFYAPADPLRDGMLERTYTAAAMKFAESAGYKVVMLTVDCAVLPARERTYGSPDWVNSLPTIPGGGFPPLRGFSSMNTQNFPQRHGHCASLCWEDVKWLCRVTEMKIVLKGIMTVDDAILAMECGVAGIVISNHGGRQLDGGLGSADVLSECVKGVQEQAKKLGKQPLDILIDGGVRRGKDVLRALALGAKAVLIGRPVLWGLALAGESGVGRVLDCLNAELTVALQLCGLVSAANVPSSSVRDKSQLYSKF